MTEEQAEQLAELTKSGLQVEFVAKKKPRGTVIKKKKDGMTVISFEMTEEELNKAVDIAIKEHYKQKEKV